MVKEERKTGGKLGARILTLIVFSLLLYCKDYTNSFYVYTLQKWTLKLC